MEMPDGRATAKRLVETTGGPRILMALLQSGPSYVKGLSYDTRLVDKTVRAAVVVLLEMKLVKVVIPPADHRVPHAKDYYDLTANGREIALQLHKCELEMIGVFDRVTRQHHTP
jgi:DNA-binding MarR family transcriptional regulator